MSECKECGQQLPEGHPYRDTVLPKIKAVKKSIFGVFNRTKDAAKDVASNTVEVVQKKATKSVRASFMTSAKLMFSILKRSQIVKSVGYVLLGAVVASFCIFILTAVPYGVGYLEGVERFGAQGSLTNSDIDLSRWLAGFLTILGTGFGLLVAHFIGKSIVD